MNTRAGHRLAFAVLAAVLAIYWIGMFIIQSRWASQPWVSGDWFINYSSGFVRRGLAGEIVRQWYFVSGVGPASTVYAFKIVVYSIYCASLLVLAAMRGLGFVDVALMLSPAGLWFELNDPDGSGRKEITLLCAFVVFVVLDALRPSSQRPFPNRWQFWYLLVVLPILTLVHEGLFLFFPCVLAYGYLTHDDDREAWLVYAIPYAVAVVAFALSYFFRGNAIVASSICSSLMAMSLDARVCSGAIDALGKYPVVISGSDVMRYVVLATLAFAPLVWYARTALDRMRWRRFAIGAGVALAATLPLYAVSEDWGRWIHVAWMLLFLTVLAARPRGVHPWRGGRAATLLTTMALALYIVAWRIPHWIHARFSPWRF